MPGPTPPPTASKYFDQYPDAPPAAAGTSVVPGAHAPNTPISTSGPAVTPGQQLPGSPTGEVDPALWAKLTAGLGVGNPNNHTQTDTLMQGLQAAGYAVKPGPVDSQGRQDSLFINGKLTRVYDSSGKWTPKVDVNGSAWDSGGGGGVGIGDFGSLLSPFGKTFSAPTAEQAAATPGYQFAMDQGLKGIDTGAAANGTLLTGGNQKDRADYAQGLASTTYQQSYQNALSDYMTELGVFRDQRDSTFDKLNTVAGRGTTAASAATQ